MSIRIQRACVPAIESRSRASVVESSFWTVPPVDRPNTSAPNEFVPDDGGGGGLVVVGALRRAALARLAASRQARPLAARVLAERALRARRRPPTSTLGPFSALAPCLSAPFAMPALAG